MANRDSLSVIPIPSLSIFKVHIKLKDWWPPSVLEKPIKNYHQTVRDFIGEMTVECPYSCGANLKNPVSVVSLGLLTTSAIDYS